MKKLGPFKKIVIVSPPQKSGGSIVLYNLCKNLRLLGYNAKIYNPCTFTKQNRIKFFLRTLKWDLIELGNFIIAKLFKEYAKKNKKFEKFLFHPINGCKRRFLPFVSKNTLVVYPEVIYGNLLNANHVVRWFLYHNPYKGDKNAYGIDDLFICYREIFNDKELNPEEKKVTMPYFNSDLYRNTYTGEKEGNCYFIRKGKDRADLPKEFDGPVLDDLIETEKVRIMNKCKYCISYDTQTFYSSMAVCCGCISVVIPEPGKKRSDYVGTNPHYGIAYGFDEEEIKFAIETSKKLVEDLYAINDTNREETKKFVSYCEDFFGK